MPALHLPSRPNKASAKASGRLLILIAAACCSFPAQAMIDQVTYTLRHDGTEDFNLTRTGPGFDNGPNNGIVRTHDTVGYEVALSTNGADTSPTIKLTLPQVNGRPIASWAMPTQCLAGSSISPDRQVITCRMEDFPGSATKSLFFEATVRGDVRNDTPFPAPAIEVTSDKVPAGKAPATLPGPVRITAAPFYDVKLEMSFPGSPAAYGVAIENGPLPDRKDGIYHRPLIGLYAQNPDRGGKKGVEQLDPTQPVTVELDISGYPDSVRVLDWDTGATGSYRTGCGSAVTNWEQYPGPLGGSRVNINGRVADHGPLSRNAVDTVANGGTCSVLPGSTQDHVTISVQGIDTQLNTYPTKVSGTQAALPADEFWVANKALVLWTDLAEYPANQRVTHPFRLKRLTGTSISNQPIPAPAPNPAYHEISHDIVSKGQGTIAKTFSVDDTAPPDRRAPRDPAFTTGQDVNYISPEQSVRSILRFSNTGTVTANNVMLCDILDRTAFDLDTHFSARIDLPSLKDPGAIIQYEYGAPPAGDSRYFSSTDSAPTPYEVVGSSSVHGSSSYSQASCQNPQIQWFDTPQAAEAAGGLVYVRATLNRVRPQGAALLRIQGMKMRRTWASTITVQSPSVAIRQGGDEIPRDTIIRNRAEITAGNVTTDNTKLRDHLMVVPTRTMSRVTKKIVDPASADKNPVPAGSVLTYEIVPRYSTLYPPLKDTVIITDILPRGTYYLDGTATVGGQPMEPVVQENTPATGMTTLTWTFPDRLPHAGNDGDPAAELPAIRFRARLSNHLVNQSLVRNLVWINGGANDFEEHCRYHAASQTLVMTRPHDQTEVACNKAAIADTRVNTPPGFLLQKSASREKIEPGDPFEYTLTFISMGKEISVPNVPDMIDILPFVGDGESRPAQGFSGRNPASDFDEGAYRLVSVTPPQRDANARIYYTNRPPKEIHNDPRDPSNALMGGSTKWCLETELGMTGCPATIGESTAIRINPSLQLLQANIAYEARVSLVSDPLKSHDGNIFANHVGTRPRDPGSPLLFVQSQSDLHVKVVREMSGLSGRIFVDMAQDGRFDQADTPLAGQCVRLTGSNARQSPVTFSRRTDAQGQFSFTPGLLDQIHLSEDCSGTPLKRFGGLLDGTYTLSRAGDPTLQAGRSHAGSAGGTVSGDQRDIGQIVLGRGATGVDYHFTEQPIAPRLTLVSTVTNDHGGTASTGDIALRATAGNADQPVAQGTSGTPAVTRVTVPVGPIQLDAPGLPGYLAGRWQCTVNGQPVAGVPGTGAPGGAGTTGATAGTPASTPSASVSATGAAPAPQALTLRHGDEAVCSVHYDDQPARLTLVSTVTNSNGRTATPQDFVLHARGPVTLTGVTGEPAITGAGVLPGAYELSEDELPNYVAGAWQCDAGSLEGSRLQLSLGEHATCTINNTDQPVSLTLVLDVVNEHGGTATERDTTVAAHGPDSIHGISGTEAVTVAPVRPGIYRLPLPALPGYVSGKWVCSAGHLDGDLLTISNQQNITCRIVLKDIPATLTATKAVVGQVQPIDGSSTDYQVQYRLTVKHESGAAALYALTDTPAFDPDVKVINTGISRNGQSLTAAANDGSWVLAEQQRLAIGAEDVYLMDFRIRVPYGSNTTNNRCASGAAAQGKGLFNRLSLRNLSAEAADAAPITAQACVDTPVPVSKARLSIEKTSTSRSAEVGDLISYRLRIRNHGEGPAISPVVVDRLPAGFRLEPGSVRVHNARAAGITQGGVRELRIRLERIEGTNQPATAGQPPARPGAAAGRAGEQPDDVIITYRVRLGVGAQEGDGTNRVHVECLTPNGARTERCSNESRWQVQVRAGIFSEEACVAGQVFVDCNGNSQKDAEELGIPGVRLYLQNGTWMVTDSQGKYSHCGLRPRTHVLKIDGRTLPRRSRLVTSSAQNSGDAESLFIDARKGMLHRADFIEGSCSNTVIEQVKARQAQGETRGVQTEAGQPALTFESKRGVPARPLHQGTDAASQAVSRTRH